MVIITPCYPHVQCTHVLEEKRVRGAAINTVKLWVPHAQPMDSVIREWALQMLRKLQLQSHAQAVATKATTDEASEEPSAENQPGQDKMDVNADTVPAAEDKPPQQTDGMEDGQLPQEELVHTPYLPERIELPAKKAQVLQHVELLFALSVKVPEFLDE